MQLTMGIRCFFVKTLSQAIQDKKIETGDELEVDIEKGEIYNLTKNLTFSGDGVGNLEKDIMNAGGLFPYLKGKAQA